MCNQDEKGTLWLLRRGVNCCRAFGLAIVWDNVPCQADVVVKDRWSLVQVSLYNIRGTGYSHMLS